ncbi:hypothetical protein N7492_008098 [Penicillium capsulatum]|uniref:Zn(2)-C6 fungal-type domain-containing protein n=1 Tax=Penicillium capsulatum TaxID=69766 RepID=A0A9W9HSE3_9EURO|nr:hypothetical protein N7492_008098 [Penicillium capsulatum]KAJ6105508.1 hypothetical protein N7512_009025 [Penicillium capsulatum]
MSSRAIKRGTPRRRKISLACEPCREKKVRCNGEKPICGPCARRSYPIDRCVYKIENARSESNDAYLKTLHDRIRELEDKCVQHGVDVSPAPSDRAEADRGPARTRDGRETRDSLDTQSRTSTAAEGLLGLGSISSIGQRYPFPATPWSRPSNTTPSLSSCYQHRRSEQDSSRVLGGLESIDHLQSPSTNVRCSPHNPHGNVTAMGAISAAEDGDATDSPREEYYGNSSAASFMRLARDSIPIRSYMQAVRSVDGNTSGSLTNDTGLWRDMNTNPTPAGFSFEDFSLPPRPLADHLLECYWDRVYCLYPFFHRPSFEQAYENLWGSSKWAQPQLPELSVGLGGSFDSGPQSITFHCALNAIFGLGCHFSDIPVREREAAVYSFFLRSKRFVGLDLLDTSTIGVVQTLLIIALLLQSTPYPNRCWNAIGVACRVAQGLGLHEQATHRYMKPLEKEIRHRTWHGCVIMDMIVSMTYGRPSMTSHVSPIYPVPLPAMRPELQRDDPCDLSGQPCDHKLGHMTFYVSTIELYKILESILSDVYNAWQSGSNHRFMSRQSNNQRSLDMIMELDDRLSNYESNVPAVLNWTRPQLPITPDSDQRSVFQRQRNVLRARFIHLRLLLYRPMFTQLCSEERTGSTKQPDASTPTRSERNPIYTSMSVNCAAACVSAAVELVSLVYDTYRTSVTDAWWYNGFYTSTAGFVVIMSYSCRATLTQIDARTVDQTWRKCEEILMHMSSFSLSARNSLRFLQVTHQHIVQNYAGASRDDTTATSGQQQRCEVDPSEVSAQNAAANSVLEYSDLRDAETGPAINHYMNWDEMALGQEDFGFLGRFDVPDLAGWFPDVQDMSS